MGWPVHLCDEQAGLIGVPLWFFRVPFLKILRHLRAMEASTDFKRTWSRARSSALGFLIALILLTTFILDTGLPDGVAAWAPYSIAIVLALLWDGARTIASVTAAALILTLMGLWIGPLGDFQTGAVNRAIGVVTITGLGVACLYVDRARRRLVEKRDALAASQQQLHAFVDEMNSVGIVLCDLRGRVTEWNHGAQLLTGYTSDDTRGRPLHRVFPGEMNSVARWAQVCHWARRKGEVVREEVLRRRDGSWCLMHMTVKPLKNRFRRHHGYSVVIHNLAKSSAVTKGNSAKSRPISSVLRGHGGLVMYRCRLEQTRTLNYIDATVERLLGADGDVLSQHGPGLSEWTHPLDREQAWNAIEEAVLAKRPYLLVYRVVGAESKEQWVWDEGEPIITDDGRVAGLEGFLAGI
ncbi:MAG TPA: PAS domain-containing protein [Nitrospira sp.]|nr:PAS domain-containing protein [Nitrospira sp.]